jgi:hypothetical protein
LVLVAAGNAVSAQSQTTVAKRRRRERQIIVFGLLFILLTVLTIAAAAVYRGVAPGPLPVAFQSQGEDFTSNINLVCPPAAPDDMPLPPEDIYVRVLNGTETPRLATSTLNTLEGRGFQPAGAGNWTRPYSQTARIMFGEEGVQQAYTLARQFSAYELVLDNRTGPSVDVVLGDAFANDATLREPLDPELDETAPLVAPGPCLRADLVQAEPAPRILPDIPDPSASESPSSPAPSPTAPPDN